MRVIVLLFALLSSVSLVAEDVRYGSWKVGSFQFEKGIVSYANTTNSSGSLLGVLCLNSTEDCFPYIVNNLTCEEDGRYPALVAVDEGVESVSMECIYLSGKYLFALPDEFLEYIVSMNNFGVAFGTGDAKFKAIYFDLNGSAKAVIAAKQLVYDSKTKQQENGTSTYKDIYL